MASAAALWWRLGVRTYVAVHEAGHAVACWKLGLPMFRLTIVPTDKWNGAVHFMSGDGPRRDWATMLFAGMEAQRRSHPETDVEKAGRLDLAEVRRYSDTFSNPLTREAFEDIARSEAAEIVAAHWFAVDRLAWALTAAREMTARAAIEVITLAEAEWQAALRADPSLTPETYAARASPA